MVEKVFWASLANTETSHNKVSIPEVFNHTEKKVNTPILFHI